MVPSVDVGNTTTKSEIAYHWLPTTTTLTIMDPNQLELLIKLPNSTRHETLQCHTTRLIYLATTLNFVS